MGQVTQFGAWGHLEYQDQPLADAHKYRAILDFARALGDFDLNGWYNGADIDLLRASRGLAPTGDALAFDVSDDGTIDEGDVITFLSARLGSRLGDVDLDGDVDAADLTRIRGNFAEPGGWIAGDMTGDGGVDGSDFLLWQRYVGGTTVPSLFVPEPSTALIVAFWLRWRCHGGWPTRRL